VVRGLQPETEYTFRVKAGDYSGNRSARSRIITRTTGPDTQRPTAPQNTRVADRRRDAIRVAWDSSTDNVGVVEYRVFRDGSLVGTTGDTSYLDLGLDPAERYRYKIRAVDAAGNVSKASNTVSPKTVPVFVPLLATWRYLDDTIEAPPGWTGRSYSDASWPRGRAELGYGDGDESTVLEAGQMTVYLRKVFEVADAPAFSTAKLILVHDDGAVIYLNGVELVRANMPAGRIGHDTPAASEIDGSAESEPTIYEVPADALRTGWNTIAVEVHQAAPGDADLSFALRLKLLD
jgi:chitodextrinase